MALQPCLRILRAAVFAAGCVTLAAAGHSLTSGADLPLWSFGAGFLAVVALAGVLTVRERSLAEITVGVLTAQWGLHHLFTWAAGSAFPTAPAGMAMPAGHGTALHAGMAHTDLGQHAIAHGVDHGGPGMLLAHLAAALVTGWWLRQGEAALWGLLCWLRIVAAAPVRLVLVVLPGGLELPMVPVRRGPEPERHTAQEILLHDVVTRRGPPRAELCI